MLVDRQTETARDTVLTVESVLETATGCQDSALDFSSRQNTVQNHVEEVVRSHASAGLPASQAVDAILWPANLGLELFDRKRLEVEERRGRAARDVVASKGEDVDEHGESKGDAKSTEPIS